MDVFTAWHLSSFTTVPEGDLGCLLFGFAEQAQIPNSATWPTIKQLARTRALIAGLRTRGPTQPIVGFHGTNEERRAGGASPLCQAGVAAWAQIGTCLPWEKGTNTRAAGQRQSKSRCYRVRRLTQAPGCRWGQSAQWVHIAQSRNSQSCATLRGI